MIIDFYLLIVFHLNFFPITIYRDIYPKFDELKILEIDLDKKYLLI